MAQTHKSHSCKAIKYQMSEMRKREVADAATNEVEPKRAQSVLIYGEQRYEYAADVPYTT